MKEKIIEIAEVYGVRSGNKVFSTKTAQLGMVQMIKSLFGGSEYDGYKITTTEHTYLILIDNGQCCCESWGYFSSEDDFSNYIGKELASVELTDKALNHKKFEESGYYDDCGGIQFIDFKMMNGTVLQFAVYNSHNGFYGHPIFVVKDSDILLQTTL